MNAAADNPMLLAALDVALRLGWPVFPCSPVSKKPLTENGFKDATTDPARIREMWRRHPRAMVGVPTGPATGDVVDLDVGDPPVIGGKEYLERFAEHVGGIPSTAFTETGSGGFHLWFKHDPERAAGNGTNVVPALYIPPQPGTKGADGKEAKGAAIDTRVAGGFAVVAPSVRADGSVYTWCPGPEDGLAEATPRIAAILAKEEWKAAKEEASRAAGRTTGTAAPPTDDEVVRRYAARALEEEARTVAQTATGGRSHALNIAAMKMAQLVAAGAIGEGIVRGALEDAAMACGLVADEGWPAVRKTIASGFKKGMTEPRDLSKVRAKASSKPTRARAPQPDGVAPTTAAEGDDAEASSSEAGGAAGSSTETGEAPPEPNTNGFSVSKMNREFGFILVGSKAVILRERANARVEESTRLLTIEAFRAWSANRWTEFWDDKGKIKRIRFSDAWMASQFRREYDGMEFHPDPKNAPGTDSYFNLWRGFAVKPKAKVNGYAVLRDHLLNNICNGDPRLYAWVFGYLAHTVQRPRERTGTALVFRGGMGAGKTIVGAAVGSLFPSHYFLVDDPRYLTGQFNSHMAQCLLLQADEAVWAGDKHAEGRLKGLITSTEQMIEAKGVDPVRLKNYVRIVMTSNEDWVVPAGKDERRFCVLDVNPRCAQLHEYFGEMEDELANGGREALLHDLLTFDLHGINLRQIPSTEALLEQKVHSLDSVDSWWLERLTSGSITASAEDWASHVTCPGLHLDYLTAADRIGVRRKVDANVFGKRMGKLVPGLRTVRPRPSSATYEPGGHNRPRRYLFPSLAECRGAFEAALKQPVAWPDEEDESG